MSTTLSISLHDLHADEMRWVRRIYRNVEIRARYRELQPEIGQVQAIAELSDIYGLSEAQIKNILYGRRA